MKVCLLGRKASTLKAKGGKLNSMKMRKSIWFALFGLFGMGLFSCEKEPETPVDPLFEQQVFAVSEVMFQRFMFEINLSFYKGLQSNGIIGNFLLNPAEVDCPNTIYAWNPATNTMTISYGQSCQPTTGFPKSGTIRVTLSGSEWVPGAIATLETENLVLDQRAFKGTLRIEHRDVVFGDTYRQAILYQNLEYTHEDNKVSTLSGTFPAQVNRSNGLLVSYDVLGQGTGNYKGTGNFVSLITSPLQFAMNCRDLGRNGFTRGLMESVWDNADIQTSVGTGPECSTQLTLRLGDQIRNIPF